MGKDNPSRKAKDKTVFQFFGPSARPRIGDAATTDDENRKEGEENAHNGNGKKSDKTKGPKTLSVFDPNHKDNDKNANDKKANANDKGKGPEIMSFLEPSRAHLAAAQAHLLPAASSESEAQQDTTLETMEPTDATLPISGSNSSVVVEALPGAMLYQGGEYIPAAEANADYIDDIDSEEYVVPQQTVDQTILASARPVEELNPDELPLARPSEASNSSRKQKSMLVESVFVCVGLAVIAGAVLLVALLLRDTSRGNDSGLTLRDGLTREEYMLGLLPDYTQAEINRNTTATSTATASQRSPQAQAFNWSIHDPRFENYTDWKLVQRFALACLYFSTGGQTHWTEKGNWLSYEIDEAKWFWSRSTFPFVRLAYNLINETSEELSNFWLVNNRLNGTIPPEFFLLTSIRSIDLSGNQNLSGSIPSQSGNLQRLEMFLASGCDLAGTLPSELGQLHELLLLSFWGNNFHGRIPSELGLPDLMLLDLAYSNLSGSIPSELGLNRLPHLLFLHGNQLTGTIPTMFGNSTIVRLLV
ncbi:Leucine Rich Repeat [Seminavis robusta]|uniref:Leucine Rich Repeat n=1 Tax=Seminavis robusta TaxID=568900 RepID=A0A9N8HKF4_9STRA|nr:Leucine Rich Repeat [Seminavis robusta]|eukprot:Sro612_g175430.1 Leucine Rich Repeat (531) ;mRNA; r:15461-17201